MTTPVRSRSLAQASNAPSLLARLGETAAVLAALTLAASLWWMGGYCSLLALRLVGVGVEQLGLWQWTIPAGVSLIELLWWPQSDQALLKTLTFSGISAVDLLSTVYGCAIWAQGRTLPLATGIHFPAEGLGLIIPALVVSLALTFLPERLIRWGVLELIRIWKGEAGHA